MLLKEKDRRSVGKSRRSPNINHVNSSDSDGEASAEQENQ